MLSLDVREKTLHVIALLERGPLRGGRIMTLTAACDEVDMTYSQFRHAVKTDDDLRRMYQNALAMSEDIAADALVNVDQYVPDPKMAAVISKNIQWLLARRRRSDYGDHVTVEHTTTRDQELLKRLAAAREKALTEDQGPMTIDGVVSEVEDAAPADPAGQERPPFPDLRQLLDAIPAPRPAAPDPSDSPLPHPEDPILRALGLLG